MPLFPNVSHRPLLAFPEQLSEATLRLAGGAVAIAVVLGFIFDVGVVLPLVAADFALRAVAGPRVSPFCQVASLVADALLLPIQTTSGAPKQLAAALSATALAVAAVLFAVGSHAAAWFVACAVAVLTGLEASVGFCLGCRLYGLLFGRADGPVPPASRPGE